MSKHETNEIKYTQATMGTSKTHLDTKLHTPNIIQTTKTRLNSSLCGLLDFDPRTSPIGFAPRFHVVTSVSHMDPAGAQKHVSDPVRETKLKSAWVMLRYSAVLHMLSKVCKYLWVLGYSCRYSKGSCPSSHGKHQHHRSENTTSHRT